MDIMERHHGNSVGLDNAFLEDVFRCLVVPAAEERKKVIRTLNPDIEKLFNYIHEADDRFSKDAIRVGSSYQGLKVERSDEFDFTLCLNYFQVDENYLDLHPMIYGLGKYYGFQNNKVVAKSVSLDPPGVGYRSLTIGWSLNETDLQRKFEGLTFPVQASSPVSSIDLIPFSVKKQLKLTLADALHCVKYKGIFNKSTAFHGPALTVRYTHPSGSIGFPISIDISPAVRCTWSFERLGVDWPRRNSRWPPEDIIQLIRRKGVLYVAKQSSYWRLSFAQCEKVLCTHCDRDGGCRKKVHRLMKYFHKKIWWPQRNPEISSFIVKNVWMLEMEKLPNIEHWTTDKLNVRLFGCIRSLLDYVYGFIHHSSPLPQYFNPADNLLDGKDKPQLKKEYDKILHFYRNPTEYTSYFE